MTVLILLFFITACEPGDDPENKPEKQTEQPGGGLDGNIGEWGEGDEGETAPEPML